MYEFLSGLNGQYWTSVKILVGTVLDVAEILTARKGPTRSFLRASALRKVSQGPRDKGNYESRFAFARLANRRVFFAPPKRAVLDFRQNFSGNRS
jgi:hypothetical protein